MKIKIREILKRLKTTAELQASLHISEKSVIENNVDALEATLEEYENLLEALLDSAELNI